MRIAFVGGTRFIGHVAAEHALEAGHAIVLLHRGEHPSHVRGAHEVFVDRRDRAALQDALVSARPDVVVDTRAMMRVEAEACASACAAIDVPVVVLSSQDVYAQFGALNGHPCPRIDAEVDEDAPLTVPYPFRGIAEHEGGPDYDKKEVEAAYLAASRAVIVLRLPAVYGRRDPKRRFGALVDLLENGATCTLPCRGGATFRWSHAHVDDVAHAILLAAEARPRERLVLNVGEREVPTMRARAEVMAAFAGVALEWREQDAPIEGPMAIFDRQPNDFVASTARIRDRLGFVEITSEDERLGDLFAWARATRLC